MALLLFSLNLHAQNTRNATATASTINGFVIGVTVNDGGAGYYFPPSIAFSGVGSGAGAYSVVSNGAVTQIVITNAGTGYTAVPTVVIAAPSTLLYSFNSSSAYVTVPDSASLDSTTNQLTVECWYDRLASQSDWNVMVSRGDTSYALIGYWLCDYANKVNPLLETTPTGLDGGVPTGNVNPLFPAWHHYAMQYDRTNFTVWIDGSLIYSTNFSGQVVMGSNPLTIGSQNSGFRPFAGLIDEVRISSSIRYTNNFVPQLRFANDSNTVALYHFDEGGGTVVNDSSSYGNNGVISGSSAWSTNVAVASTATVNVYKAVSVGFSGLTLGTAYQLQTSSNLLGGVWSNFGSSFVATNQSMSFSNYWNVANWNQLYFRLAP